MLWFKISAEKHVSKLLQSVLLCPSLIPTSSRYASVSSATIQYSGNML